MDMSGFSLVLTTIDSEAGAQQIAETLLRARLAACVQIASVESRYVWKGEIARAQEWSLQIKARAEDFAAITKAICAIHPYETPEILRAPILEGEPAYMAWLRQSTQR